MLSCDELKQPVELRSGPPPWVTDATRAGRHAAARKARIRLQRVLDEVPWVPGVRVSNSPWTAVSADAARRELAQAAIECRQALN